MGPPFFPRAIPTYGVLPYSMINGCISQLYFTIQLVSVIVEITRAVNYQNHSLFTLSAIKSLSLLKFNGLNLIGLFSAPDISKFIASEILEWVHYTMSIKYTDCTHPVCSMALPALEPTSLETALSAA